MPPPLLPAELPERVQLLSSEMAPDEPNMPPPPLPPGRAELPERVELSATTQPAALAMPPPDLAELLETAEPLSVSRQSVERKMPPPPPEPEAELARTIELLMVSVQSSSR